MSVLPRGLAAATNFAWRRGDVGLAGTLGEKGLALCRELGNEDREAREMLLFQLGIVATMQGDLQRALALLDECLNVARDLADKWFHAVALLQMGVVAHYRGDDNRATTCLTQALAIHREVGDKWSIAHALNRFARDVSLPQGNNDQAAASFAESLTLSRETGSRWMSEECLEGLARLALATGRSDRAARLFGAAEVVRETLGHRFAPADQADHEQYVASTRARLEKRAFAAAWAEGRAMTLEQAVEYGLTVTPEEGGGTGETSPKSTAGRDRNLLTLREREIAVLIARGLSNRDIASHLGLAKRTVETHVQNILNKLNVNSRAGVAAWAVEHGFHSIH